MSNYVIKSDLKRGVGIDTSKFAEKVGLSNLTSDINRLDIDELEITTVDLSKQSNILKKNAVRKTPGTSKLVVTKKFNKWT